MSFIYFATLLVFGYYWYSAIMNRLRSIQRQINPSLPPVGREYGDLGVVCKYCGHESLTEDDLAEHESGQHHDPLNDYRLVGNSFRLIINQNLDLKKEC